MSHKYHEIFVQLQIDDIRCIPYLNDHHLTMYVRMEDKYAQKAWQRIQQFNNQTDIVECDI